MKNARSFALVLVTLCVGSGAWAACAGSPTPAAALEGNTLCVGSAPNWENQEQLRTGGQLWDYKRGPAHPTDPSAQLGTWSTSGNTVTFNYGASAYTFTVYQSGSNVCLSNGSVDVNGTVKAGTAGGCP